MSGQSSSKKAQRRAAAEAKKRKTQNRRYLLIGVGVVAVVALIVFVVTSPEPAELAGVETFDDLGGGHLDVGEPAPSYNSSPPTSGPHSPSSTSCGIYIDEIPDVIQVHNLEHGTVVIQYQPDTSDGDRIGMEEFARAKGTHVLVAPRADLTHPVVVTGWTKMLRLENADIDSIGAFYDRYARRGPELGVPCPFDIDQSA